MSNGPVVVALIPSAGDFFEASAVALGCVEDGGDTSPPPPLAPSALPVAAVCRGVRPGWAGAGVCTAGVGFDASAPVVAVPRSAPVGRGVKDVFWCSPSMAGCAGAVVVVGGAVVPAAAGGGLVVTAAEGAGGGGGTSSGKLVSKVE